MKVGTMKVGTMKVGTMRMRKMVSSVATLVCLALSSCATDLPFSTTSDSSAGLASCELLGDGFVRTGDRRIPLEAFVLELRQATRAMTSDERSRYVVTIGYDSNIEDGIAAKNIGDGREYLLQHLQIMGVLYAGG